MLEHDDVEEDDPLNDDYYFEVIVVPETRLWGEGRVNFYNLLLFWNHDLEAKKEVCLNPQFASSLGRVPHLLISLSLAEYLEKSADGDDKEIEIEQYATEQVCGECCTWVVYLN